MAKVQTTIWDRATAEKVNLDPTNTKPITSGDFPVLLDDVFIWDTMPLRNLKNEIVSIDGWNIIFTLTAWRQPEKFIDEKGEYDITADWNDRHGRARICFWYCRDGKSWQFGGRVMEEGVSPTSREWAGTPILLNKKCEVDLYYTCVTPGATIAKVRGKIKTTKTKVEVEGFTDVKELFSADGKIYQTEEQNPYWNFRDPCPFIDPKSGKLYMVFEGNVAGDRGTHQITHKEKGFLPPTHRATGGSQYQVGCVGIAEALDKDGNEWKLLPPLITAVGVNDQTERPHFVFQNGMYYLFTISHQFTYADFLSGPDGIYGFASKKLLSDYQPMNGSGLVLGNPKSQPFQGYSDYVMQNGLVTSFIDSVEIDQPNSLKYRIGGTLAPTVQLKFKGYNSYYVEKLDYGFIPAMKDIKSSN